MDYAASKDFNPQWDTDPHQNDIMRAHKDKKYDEVVVLGEDWLKKCPVDIWMHLALADSYAGLKNKEQSDQHMQAYQGLLGSIAASGDGLSENNPFSVISSAETHAVVQSLKGKNAKFQMLPSGIETVEFKDDNDTPYQLYFKYAKEYWDHLPD